MIHPQVPLRIPCDDLTYLVILRFVSNEPRQSITRLVWRALLFSQPQKYFLFLMAFKNHRFLMFWDTSRSHCTDGFPVCSEPQCIFSLRIWILSKSIESFFDNSAISLNNSKSILLLGIFGGFSVKKGIIFSKISFLFWTSNL